jgi:DNA-binding beta-propeller fold protein YncE
MWVTGQFENTVTKIRANDGTVLGTFKVGNTPVGVAFDGVNVWVSNGGGTVTKLQASDGKVIRQGYRDIPGRQQPTRCCF